MPSTRDRPLKTDGGRSPLLYIVLVLILVVAAAYVLRPSSAETMPASPAARTSADEAVQPEMPVSIAAASEPLLASGASDAAGTGRFVLEVVDESGQAVQGALVQLFPEDPASDVASGRTDAEGLVVLEALAGRHELALNADAGLSNRGHVRELVVLPAQAIEARRVLPTLTSRLEIRVLDDSGAPVAGVRLSGDGPGKTATEGLQDTSADGLAVWEPVIDGLWFVRIEGGDEALDLSQRQSLEVEVSAGGTARGDILVSRKARVSVRVPDGEDASALESLRLSGPGMHDSRLAPLALPSTWLVPGGSYILYAEWDPSSPWWSRPIPVVCAPGEIQQLTLRPETGLGELEGRVTDAAGVPVEGAIVSLSVMERAAAPFPGRDSPQPLVQKRMRTDSAGRWDIRGLPDGEATLSVRAATVRDRYLADPGRTDSTRIAVRGARQEVPDIVVRPAYVVVLRLDGAQSTALGDSTGAPRLQVEHLLGQASPVNARLEPDGSCRLDHLPAGPYSVQIEMPDGEIRRATDIVVDDALPEGATCDFLLRLDSSS